MNTDQEELDALRHFVEQEYNLRWDGSRLVPIEEPVPQSGDSDYLEDQHNDLWCKLQEEDEESLCAAVREVHLSMSSATLIDGFDEHWIAELSDGRFIHVRSVFLDPDKFRVSYYANKEDLIDKADLIVLSELTCDEGWEAVSEREKKEWE